jgi:hypothetical protein
MQERSSSQQLPGGNAAFWQQLDERMRLKLQPECGAWRHLLRL